MAEKGQILTLTETGDSFEFIKTSMDTNGQEVSVKFTLKSKGKAHNHYNMQDTPLVMIQTVTPALDFEMLVENLVGLSNDGKIKNGKAGIIQDLVTLKYLDSKTYLASIPIPIQQLLMNTIAPIARMFGYRAIYKKYSGVEK